MGKKKAQSIKIRYPIFTLLILSVSAVSFFSSKITLLLIFDRAALIQGEIWRLLSSHFVHFTPVQLAYNLLVFGIAGSIVERKSRLDFGILCIAMALVISTTLFILRPAMIYYGGLSGLACGFIFYCALLGFTESGPWKVISKLIIILLPIKIFFELYNSASILPYWGQQNFVIMPISHITGVAVSLIFYFVVKYSNVCTKHRLHMHRMTC
jgi:rhomboid family GlyGly-CTERM serine protease